MEIVLKNKVTDTYNAENHNLLNYIKSRIADSTEAEDILHDVYCQALTNLNVFNSLNSVQAWLYKVARNKVTDWYRKKENQNTSLLQKNEEGIWDELLIDSGIRIEDEFERNLIGNAILRAIDELPKDQKIVFIANEIKGITFKELSEQSGVSINTLIARKRYAVLTLRKQLKEIKELIETD